MKTIIFSVKAAKELDGLPEPARINVSAALNSYAIDGRGDVKKLKGREGYRLRIGDYRVIFAEDAETILSMLDGGRRQRTSRMERA